MLQVVVEKTSTVLSAPSFPQCSAATLRLILEQDSLSLRSELDLVQACVRWGQHQITQKAGDDRDAPLTVRDALGELVFLLRLRGLSGEQLARHVAPSGLLTAEEQSALFCCVLTKGDSPMPHGFADTMRTCLNRPGDADQSACANCVEQLQTAARKGDLETVKSLLDAKTSVDGSKGLSALLTAVKMGRLEVVQLLLDRGANMEKKDCFYRTVLHIVVSWGNIQVAKVLIERGCNVNATDYAGDTPLIFAIRSGNFEMIRVLLEGGANPRIPNQRGESPLLLAALKECENRESKVVKVIQEHLSKPVNRPS